MNKICCGVQKMSYARKEVRGSFPTSLQKKRKSFNLPESTVTAPTLGDIILEHTYQNLSVSEPGWQAWG